jgi:hypothetical protein
MKCDDVAAVAGADAIVAGDVQASQLVADEWSYKAEGNINVVFTYKGKNPHLWGHVLRVRKLPRHGAPVSGVEGMFDNPTGIEFARDVVRPLLGSFVVPALSVAATPALIDAMQRRLCAAKDRPASRVNDFQRDAACVVLMRDTSVPPVMPHDTMLSPHLCVEIKPKWGSVPQTGFGASLPDDPRSFMTRYCMHQVRRTAWMPGYVCPAVGVIHSPAAVASCR